MYKVINVIEDWRVYFGIQLPSELSIGHNSLSMYGQLFTELFFNWINTRLNMIVIIREIIDIVLHWWRFGAVGSDVGRINEVTLRRARLVLGWVTVSGFNSRCGKFISV